MPQDRCQTVGEVADRLKVAEAAVRHWIKSGDLRAINIGKGWRVADADLAMKKGGSCTFASSEKSRNDPAVGFQRLRPFIDHDAAKGQRDARHQRAERVEWWRFYAGGKRGFWGGVPRVWHPRSLRR